MTKKYTKETTIFYNGELITFDEVLKRLNHYDELLEEKLIQEKLIQEKIERLESLQVKNFDKNGVLNNLSIL